MRPETTRALLKQREEALEHLLEHERRLRRIEQAISDWGERDPGRAMSEIKEWLPWDDANEHGSWWFTEEEALR